MKKKSKLETELEVIKRGIEELITEEEIVQKIRSSGEKGESLKIKAGFDPSSPDLHLGHMVLLKKLRDFQELGHKVYFLIGDFTARIGDPSGQKETRPRLSREEVEQNARTYREQIFKILQPENTEIVFNSSWLEDMKFQDVLELASHYTVARILERDDFLARYREGKPISIAEFLYPLIQGYDSVILKADIEIGGRDQKFNLLVGRELQRDFGMEPQVIITLPILEGTDGVQKMSKSYGNSIAIQDPPRDMFGKIMSIPDELTLRYADLLTNLELAQLERMPPRDAKLRLAEEIVGEIYGKEEGLRQKQAFIKVFSERGIPDQIEEYKLPSSALKDNKVWIVELLTLVGFANSNSEARRLIRQGAVSIDGERIGDENLELSIDESCILRVGRYRFKKILI